jgi:hypothetical protein
MEEISSNDRIRIRFKHSNQLREELFRNDVDSDSDEVEDQIRVEFIWLEEQ